MRCKLSSRNMPFGFNFNMESIWKLIAMVVLGLFFVNMFFKNYYKEKTAGNLFDRIKAGAKSTLIFFVLYMILGVTIYFVMGNVKFSTPYKVADFVMLDFSEAMESETTVVFDKNYNYSASTDFLLAILSPLVVLGSVAFSVFGGAGLAFFPLELILNYLFRPQRPEPEEHILSKKVLLQASESIINKARDTYDLRRDIDINPINNPIEKKMKLKVVFDSVEELKKELIDLEDIFQIFKIQDNIVDSNPLYYTISLILGIFFGAISLTFVIHTFLATQGFYVVLESIFAIVEWINTIFSLLFFLIVSIFIGIATTKGSIKMGGILSFILDSGPFKVNGTWTDTFLTNNNNLMLSFLGLIVYFIKYMPNYFRFLAADLIFNKLITKIGIIAFIYNFNIMEYLFLLFFLVAIFASCFMPTGKAILDAKVQEKKAELEAEKERLEEMKKEEKTEEDKTKK